MPARTTLSTIVANLSSYGRRLPRLPAGFFEPESGQKTRHLPCHISGIENRQVVRKLLQQVKNDPKVVLDLGSGIGLNLCDIRHRFPASRIIAGDISAFALNVSSAIYGGSNRLNEQERIAADRDIEFQSAHQEIFPNFDRQLSGVSWAFIDANAIPLRSASVDLVVATEMFEHLKDRGSALDEIYRILTPGGSLLLTSPNYGGNLVGWIKLRADRESGVPVWNPGHSHYKNRSPEYRLIAGDLIKSIRKRGFEIRQARGYSFLLAWLTPFITSYDHDGGIPVGLRDWLEKYSGFNGAGRIFRTSSAQVAVVAEKI